MLKYDNSGAADTVLRYEHYSVVMSKSRRMCFFSAVNIDGSLVEEERARRDGSGTRAFRKSSRS